MAFQILNCNKIAEKNWFLSVKKVNGKECLTVVHKSFLGRVWRELGFGDASLKRVFNYLDKNSKEFDFSRIENPTATDNKFFETLISYVKNNPKFCLSVYKINQFVKNIFDFLNIKTPESEDYRLNALPFYNRFVRPAAFAKEFDLTKQKMQTVANHYFQGHIWKSPFEEDFMTEVKNCPQLASLYTDEIERIGVEINREVLQTIVKDFSSIKKISIGHLEKEKFDILKTFKGDLWIRQDASHLISSFKDFKNNHMGLKIKIGNLEQFPSLELKKLEIELDNKPSCEILSKFCQQVVAEEIVIRCGQIETIQYTPDLYEGECSSESILILKRKQA